MEEGSSGGESEGDVSAEGTEECNLPALEMKKKNGP